MPEQQGSPKTIGQYELIEKIGQGATATVYRANDRKLKRQVALKTLHTALVCDETRRRFESESVIAARLSHPNVVCVYDSGSSNGRYYIAYELIEGVSLREWLPVASSIDAVVSLFVQICRGVASAHEAKVIHRDLKPENILVDVQGIAHISDFGLAIMPEIHLTTRDSAIGTIAYMAPEQARGKLREISPASDVFAIGTMIFEVLTSSLPGRGVSPAEYLACVSTRQAPLSREINSAIPLDLAAIIDKCLSLRPHGRYRDASELLEDLRRYQSNEETRARPLTRLNIASRWVGRHKTFAATSVAFMFTIVASILLIVNYALEAHKERRRTETQARAAESAAMFALSTCRPDSIEEFTNTLKPIRNRVKRELLVSIVDRRLTSVALSNSLFAYATLFPEDQEVIEYVCQHAGVVPPEILMKIGAAFRLSKSRSVIESAIDRHLSGRVVVDPSLAMLSLVAGTGNLAKMCVAADSDQSDRERFISFFSRSNFWECFSPSLVQEVNNVDILIAILIGTAEMDGVSHDLISKVIEQALGLPECDQRLASAITYLTATLPNEQDSPEYLERVYPVSKSLVPIKVNNTRLLFLRREIVWNDLRKAQLLPNSRISKVIIEECNTRSGQQLLRPISAIGLDDIKEICDLLSRIEGLPEYYGEDGGEGSGYRVPTIQEWRIAALANAETKYCFGDQPDRLSKYAWISTFFNSTAISTQETSSRRPNAIGVFDTYGNVEEVVTEDGEYRTVGGSAWSIHKECDGRRWPFKAASRMIGFRVVRTPQRPRDLEY